MSNHDIIDMLGRVGIDLLDLADGYRRVRARYLPGQLEYEQASGAIMALDQLADRVSLALTSGGKVTRLPRREQRP